MEAVTAAAPPKLPVRLLRFFAKYPPQLYSAKYTGQTIPFTRKEAKLLRIQEAEQKEQRKALLEAGQENSRLKAAADPKAKLDTIARHEAFNTQLREVKAERRAAHEAAIIRKQENLARSLQRAPVVEPIIKMTAIMKPRYISLQRLERYRREFEAGKREAAPTKITEDTPSTEVESTGIELPSAADGPIDRTTEPQSDNLSTTPSTDLRSRKYPANPFLPLRQGKRWRGACVSLRRQAELVKLAKKYGVEALLPYGRKSTHFRQQRLLQHGLRVKGTGEGQKVKGHKWERNLEATIQKRMEAIQNMPALIREWKQKGHGKGMKKEKFPKVKLP